MRGDIERGVPLQIADGDHRVCATSCLGDDIDIPYRIVGLVGPASDVGADAGLTVAVTVGGG